MLGVKQLMGTLPRSKSQSITLKEEISRLDAYNCAHNIISSLSHVV